MFFQKMRSTRKYFSAEGQPVGDGSDSTWPEPEQYRFPAFELASESLLAEMHYSTV
jgi:hypothetical protein